MCKSCFGLQEREDKGRASTSSCTLFFLVGPQSSSGSAAVCNNQCAKVAENKYTPTFDTYFRNVYFWQNKLPPCSHSQTLSCSRGPRMHAEFPNRILYVELFPVCNPSSEMDSRVGADRSQRQWFKGQNQQQESLLVKKRLTDTSWWETVFAESSEASLSCLHLTAWVKLHSCCGYLPVYLVLGVRLCHCPRLSLVSWVNVCWPHPSLGTCQVEWIESVSPRINDDSRLGYWCGRCRVFLRLWKVFTVSIWWKWKVRQVKWAKWVIKLLSGRGKWGTPGGRAHTVVD